MTTALEKHKAIQDRLDTVSSDPQWLNDALAELRDLIEADLAAAAASAGPPPAPVVPQIFYEHGFDPAVDKTCGVGGPRAVFGTNAAGNRVTLTARTTCNKALCQFWNGNGCSLANPHQALMDRAEAIASATDAPIG